MKEKVEYKRDHLTLRGHLFAKDRFFEHAVILCHGFLANEKTCFKYAKLLSEEGYGAFTFDFCGVGLGCSSDGKSEEMSIFSELEDLKAFIDGVKETYQIKDLSLLGCSQGGLVCAMAAKEKKEEIDSLILMYPALCIPDDARKGKMMFYSFDPQNIPALLGRFPMKLGGVYARSVIDKDVYGLIGGYDGPVLYLHGTKDEVVDISYARKAKDLYPNCQYHEIIDGGHMFKGEQDKQACALLKKFMKRN